MNLRIHNTALKESIVVPVFVLFHSFLLYYLQCFGLQKRYRYVLVTEPLPVCTCYRYVLVTEALPVCSCYRSVTGMYLLQKRYRYVLVTEALFVQVSFSFSVSDPYSLYTDPDPKHCWNTTDKCISPVSIFFV